MAVYIHRLAAAVKIGCPLGDIDAPAAGDLLALYRLPTGCDRLSPAFVAAGTSISRPVFTS